MNECKHLAEEGADMNVCKHLAEEGAGLFVAVTVLLLLVSQLQRQALRFR